MYKHSEVGSAESELVMPNSAFNAALYRLINSTILMDDVFTAAVYSCC